MKNIDSVTLGRKCSQPRKEVSSGNGEKPQQNGEVRAHSWLQTGTSRAERWKSFFLATDRFSRNPILQNNFSKATQSLDYMISMHKGGAIAYPVLKCSRTWNQLPSHNGKGLLQLPLARHVIFWGPTRWYPELHTKVTLLLYVLPVEMASAFSMEGWSPQVISRTEENFWVLYTMKTIPSMSHTPSDSSVLILN